MSQFRCEGGTVLADPETIFFLPLFFSSAIKLNVFLSSFSTILLFQTAAGGATKRIFI